MIVILTKVLTMTRQYGNVYYSNGNIYQPISVHGSESGRVRGAINKFIKANRATILADRAQPDYKTLEELMAEQDLEFAVQKT